MVASWYGQKYHGRQTASGAVYDMYALTAAHKSLPFGTRLRVTHPGNRRSVVVEINDRGPFIRGRDLDLSLGAARALVMVDEGVARVHIERMN
jgi:rare lipoprotein A